MKKNKLLLSFLYFFLQFSQVSAQFDIHWLNKKPHSNELTQKFWLNANEGWQGDNYGNLIHTTDSGRTWVNIRVADDIIGSVFFKNSQEGFVGVRPEKLYRTLDGGQTWTYWTLPNGGTADIKGIHFRDNLNGILATYFEYYTTNDGGNTWTQQTNPFNGFLHFHFKTPLLGWAVGYSGLNWVTSDGGVTWTQKNNIPVATYQSNRIFTVSADTAWVCGTSGKMFYTFNAGNIWSMVGTGVTVSLNDLYFFSGKRGFAVGNVGNAVQTTNGTSFSVIMNQFSGNMDINNIHFTDPTHAVTGGEGCFIHHSWDSGVNWELNDFGPVSSVNNLKAFGKDSLYASTVSGDFLKSLDGGQTWSVKPVDYQSYKMDFLNPSLGFLCARTMGGIGKIYRTLDGGTTWAEVHSMGSDIAAAINVLDANTIVACGTAGKVWLSTNGGNTWVNRNLQFTSHVYYCIQALNANEFWMGGQAGYIAHTTDAGLTWTRTYVGVTQTIRDLQFINPIQGFACGDNALMLKTTNGGTNWQILNASNGSLDYYNIQAFNEKDIIALGELGLQAVSYDGGNTIFRTSTYLTSNNYEAADFLNIFEGFGSGTNGMIVKMNDRRNKVSGKVFADLNNNGLLDLGENGIPNVLIQTLNGQFCSTDSLGNYYFMLEYGSHTLSIASQINGFVPNPSSLTKNFNFYYEWDSTAHFPMQASSALSNINIQLTSTSVTRNDNNSYNISITNLGNQITDADVSVQFSPQNTFISAEGNPILNGQTLTWNLQNMSPFETKNFDCVLDLNGMLPGDTLKTYASATLPVTDAYPIDNFDTLRTLVRASFDPNDKLVQPGNKVPMSFVQQGKEVKYTIRFQNTGNDTAFKVWIVDTLSNLLDMNTFRMIQASHPYELVIDSNRVRWTFNPIYLVDSTTNEPESHGFVTFAIQVQPNVTACTQIDNFASIYFDKNAPIQTNNGYLIIEPNAPLASNASICSGNSASLTASGGSSYAWYNVATGGTKLASTASFTTPTLTSNTTYYVENIENGCTSSRTAVQVTVSSSVSAPIAQSVSICSGTTASLTASGGSSYAWYSVASGGTALATSSTFTTPNLTTNTTYYVENISGNCTSSRTSVVVNVTANVNPTFNSQAAICAGTSFTLPTTSNNNITGTWSPVINNTTTTTYTFTPDAGQCANSAQMTVTVNSIPNASFSANTNTLTASPSGATYQWLLNGTPISSATSETYTITQSGQYAVIVTQNGCSDTTANQTITFTTLDIDTQSEIKVYPNPFENEFNIQVQEAGETYFVLFDLLGKEIKTGSFTGTELSIPVHNLGKGTYLLRVISGSKAQEFRLVKN